MRTLGVEEELVVVDPGSGVTTPRGPAVVAAAQPPAPPPAPDRLPAPTVRTELMTQQIEINTAPQASLTALAAQLRELRDRAGTAARECGSEIAALATTPLPGELRFTQDPRYRALAARFGKLAAEHLTCGCHVHVAVAGPEEAVAVLDRIRIWLPALLALSANGPYWQGEDSGYASYRPQVMHRWPCAGPTEVFGSAQAYETIVTDMVDSGVILDRGMVYFEARASHRYPTVEVRTPDVCLDAADTVTIAGLVRALVETAAAQWAAGVPPPPVPGVLLRLAAWQAGHAGPDGQLLDPRTARPRAAGAVLADLLEHVRPALARYGDEEVVEAGVERVLRRGSGARRQRSAFARAGRLRDVVRDAVAVTAGDV